MDQETRDKLVGLLDGRTPEQVAQMVARVASEERAKREINAAPRVTFSDREWEQVKAFLMDGDATADWVPLYGVTWAALSANDKDAFLMGVLRLWKRLRQACPQFEV